MPNFNPVRRSIQDALLNVALNPELTGVDRFGQTVPRSNDDYKQFAKYLMAATARNVPQARTFISPMGQPQVSKYVPLPGNINLFAAEDLTSRSRLPFVELSKNYPLNHSQDNTDKSKITPSIAYIPGLGLEAAVRGSLGGVNFVAQKDNLTSFEPPRFEVNKNFDINRGPFRMIARPSFTFDPNMGMAANFSGNISW
jgi:hypothetical protein